MYFFFFSPSGLMFFISSLSEFDVLKWNLLELKDVSFTVYSLQHLRTHLPYALWHTSRFVSWWATNKQPCSLLANVLTLNCAFIRADACEPVKCNISSYHCLMSNEVLLWLICIVTNYMILLGYFIFSFFFFSSVLRRTSQPSINRNTASSSSGKSRAINFVELVVVWTNSDVLVSTLFFVQLKQELIMLQTSVSQFTSITERIHSNALFQWNDNKPPFTLFFVSCYWAFLHLNSRIIMRWFRKIN